MNTATRLLTIGGALWLSACAHSLPIAAQSNDNALLPTALIATAEAHRGQIVTVRGYFTWSTDTRALWESRDAYLDAQQERKGQGVDYWAKCVTIYPAGDARGLSARRVRVTGTVTVISEDDMRSLWTCNAVALKDAVVAPQ